MRKIIHVDMDAFFASVEQRDNPSLRGKPVIVGGAPGSRGVVAACSYEARKFGIHSAMPSTTAYRLCPKAVFIRGSFEKYKTVSSQIREIFLDYTDLVEPLSLDEAYLDVTYNRKNMPSATIIADEIRNRIKDKTGLTASAGVSYNKFLAKVASDYNKPNGMTVIVPEKAVEFISSLEIRKFHGIGKATEKKMNELGIRTGDDLKKMSLANLVRIFGKAGEYYYYICRGIDNRTVNPHRIRKSIGKEITFKQDIDDYNELLLVGEKLSYTVSEIMSSHATKARTVTLKVKYDDFEQITRSHSFNEYTGNPEKIFETVADLMNKTEAGLRKVRLIGVTVSGLDLNEDDTDSDIQLFLPFDDLKADARLYELH